MERFVGTMLKADLSAVGPVPGAIANSKPRQIIPGAALISSNARLRPRLLVR